MLGGGGGGARNPSARCWGLGLRSTSGLRDVKSLLFTLGRLINNANRPDDPDGKNYPSQKKKKKKQKKALFS